MMPPDAHIPGKATIIPYYAVAAIAFVVLSAMCLEAAPAFTGHYFQPKLLSVTHLAALGWATMIIFGASNQLTPVIAAQPLYSERIPVIVLILLTGGTAILVTGFRLFLFNWVIYAGGISLLMAFLLHAINIWQTMRHKKDIICELITTAHIWLIVTALIGLLILIHLRFPFLPEAHLHYLKLHAAAGMGGWLLQLVTGVSSRLIPMFLLSRKEEKKWLHITYYTYNAGLLLLLADGIILHTGWGIPTAFILILTGLGFYLAYVRKCYQSAMRRQTDYGMKQTLLALALLSLPFLIAFLLLTQTPIQPQTAMAYGFAFFGGFISVIIMGQTFKTLPFIVWMHITRQDLLPEIFPKDLFNERAVQIQMLLYLPGFLLFLTGIFTRQIILLYAGSGLMTIAACWYCIHVFYVIHKLKTQ